MTSGRQCQRCSGTGIAESINNITALAYLLGAIRKPRATGHVTCPQCGGSGRADDPLDPANPNQGAER